MGKQNFFFVLCSWQDKKTSFSISLPSSKLTISLISIYKHYAINIADPSSMQDACHMNFIKDHALCGSVVEHQSTESEDISKILLTVCHKISFEFVNQQI